MSIFTSHCAPVWSYNGFQVWTIESGFSRVENDEALVYGLERELNDGSHKFVFLVFCWEYLGKKKIELHFSTEIVELFA